MNKRFIILILVGVVGIAIFFLIRTVGLWYTDIKCAEKYGEQWKGQQLDRLFVCVDPTGQMKVL